MGLVEQQIDATQARALNEESELRGAQEQVVRLREDVDELESVLLAAKTSDADTLAYDAALEAALEKVLSLKGFLGKRPEFDIPETRLASASDWLRVTSRSDLRSEADLRKVAAALRMAGKNAVSSKIRSLLIEYVKQNPNLEPFDMDSFIEFGSSTVDASILGRYRVAEEGETRAGERLLLLEDCVDPIWDHQLGFGQNGTISVNRMTDPSVEAQTVAAMEVFSRETGIAPRNGSDLRRFLPSTVPIEIAEEILSAISTLYEQHVDQ